MHALMRAEHIVTLLAGAYATTVVQIDMLRKSGLIKENRVDIRSLTVLASAPHDDIRRGCLGPQIPLVGLVASSRFLEEAEGGRSHAAEVAARVARHNTEQALTRLLGEIGLLENTLGGVNVGKVECRARMTRIEDSCETGASWKILYPGRCQNAQCRTCWKLTYMMRCISSSTI